MLVMRNLADKQGLQVKVNGSVTPPSLKGGFCLPKDCPKRLMCKGQGGNAKNLRLILEWMRTVIIKEWDGEPEVSKCGAVGGALEFLRYMCKETPSTVTVKHSKTD